MKILAEIYSQGEEVVTGQILDSNAAWLAQQLQTIGFKLKRHTTVGDHLQDLADTFVEISKRADFCVCTGGLGPTSDDLTAAALSLASGLELAFDADALANIESYFARRHRPMPETNRKQAFLPQGSVRIDNPVGTAPGFSLQLGRCLFVCLPGVPTEMKAMFTQSVLPQLPLQFELKPDRLISLRTVGIGESAIQQALKNLQLPDDVELGFRAALAEVQVKLLFPDYYADSQIHSWVDTVKGLLGDEVYAIEGLDAAVCGDLLAVIDNLMCLHQHELVLMESVSFGLLAHTCLLKSWLKHAILIHPQEYSESEYRRHLEILQTQYPEAIGLTQSCQHTLAEIADPNQTITLRICLHTPALDYHKDFVLAGSLNYKQQQAATYTLDFLRRYLSNLCL